ncbi:MAG: MGH1-like glycoside hydrolase domain-containing protein [Bryobacteraceae bacterium]
MTAEQVRLVEAQERRVPWKLWGPYLSERAWGTVREDYSPYGTAWEYFPHDHARSRAYRWGEDGLGGICDRRQLVCFAVALWNGQDPILKERLFGLTGNEGKHGEDVKEYCFYLDSTPTHSYMKYLYKYPQRAFPYTKLIEENGRRNRSQPEYELLDTGAFDGDRYFDVFVEYAKAAPEDILIRITVFNRSGQSASLELLPQIWFRNTWSWGLDARKPRLEAGPAAPAWRAIRVSHYDMVDRWLLCQGSPEVLFTENETNFVRLFGAANHGPYVKDGINDYIVSGKKNAVNPELFGTKTATRYRLHVGAGQSAEVDLRLSSNFESGPFGDSFDQVLRQRRREADEFYEANAPKDLDMDERLIQRQAFAALLWSKQFYNYNVRRWLRGDPAGAEPPRQRLRGRNSGWTHVNNADVISMPDKWEYPWYAAWDLAFHCIPLALIDPAFAKEQLLLLLREWYMHPNGQLPAYEWNFSDVNPPVHAWAVWRVYKIEEKDSGRRDRGFLERAFHKLLLNFTWWVNRKDSEGNNIFQGGFLGLDNVGVLDRSGILPKGGVIEQSDATSWMGMYCLNMMTIALELSKENPAYEDVASKFLEHFVYISRAMNNIAGQGIELWDRKDRWYYDVLHRPNGASSPMRVRSLVGLIPLFAVEILDSELIDTLPGFKRRMQYFIDNLPEFGDHVETVTTPTNIRRFFSLVSRDRLQSVLALMLDESEFLSPYGIRSLSRYHRDHPFILRLDHIEHRIDYQPAESQTGLFGGNSNWRGPVWFPINFLIIEALQKFHYFFGGDVRVECPAGSGVRMDLWQVSLELQRRLTRLFRRDERGRRPVFGTMEKFQSDPHWRDCLLFFEYFHGQDGRGLGASHQGWTALVAKLIQQSYVARDREMQS